MKESSFYSDDFEQLIREKTEQYKMYPSEKVWKGVHNSLHTKRRWFIGSMAVLVTGILFLAGRELIAPSNHALALHKAAKGSPTDFATKPPLAENILHAPLTAFHSPATASAANVRRNAIAGDASPEDQDPAYRGISITLSNPVINPSDLSEWLSKVVQLPDRAPDLTVIAVRTPASDAGKMPEDVTKSGVRTGAETASSREAFEESRESTDETDADGLTARGVLESLSARGAEKARNGRHGGHLANSKSSGGSVTADGRLSDGGAANASPSAIAEAEDRQRVNWLQDYAMNILPAPSRRGRTYFQLSLAPTLNYRMLGGLDPSIEKFGPTPNGFTVQPGDRINHSGAFGFEFGGSILYRLTRNLSVKGGLQFNFARYRITAFNNSQLGATYSYYGYVMDSMSRAANTQQASAGGYGPVTTETLNNDYYQLSAPVGFELRVLGNERLQFNLGATVQPSYLLGTTSYILSQDKTAYSRDPDRFRRWNLYGGLEAFLSYRVGNLRWQIGPEFRYQLLSSYNSQTPFSENLKSYGLKIGITKMLP